MRHIVLVLIGSLLWACGGQPTRPPARPAPNLPPAAVDTPIDLPAAGSPYGHPARPEALADLLADDVGKNPLRIHMIDIGQGDALLIESPSGKWILLDAGPRKGRKALMNYLQTRRIRRLHMAVSSHAHSDHIANMDVAINRYRPGVMLDSGVPHTTRDYARLLDAIEAHKVQLRIARKGRQITIDPGVVMRVLGPEEPLVQGSRSDLNANSVVFRLEYDQFTMLFTGDAEEETEQRLLKSPQTLKATVLKVAHHGSAHASTSAFLAAVQPRMAIISAAKKNRYGHPAPETLQRLTQANATIFDTPRHGHIVLSTDGKRIQIHTQKRKTGLTPAVAAGFKSMGVARKSNGGIDINTASAKELVKLPGVGKATAKRIIEYRSQNGPFRSVDDLVKVRGIGKKSLRKFRDRIRVTVPRS